MNMLKSAADIEVELVFGIQNLCSLVMARPYEYRLISFCSNVIVPKDILCKLHGPGYNFHPGSPDYPGKYPVNFALYERAPVFGVTAHEMEAVVDSGPIVGVGSFDSSKIPSLDRLRLGTHFQAIRLLQSMIPRLVSPAPLEHLSCRWGARRCSLKAVEEICTVSAGIGAEELERLIACFGGIAPIRTVIAGKSFVLAPQSPIPAGGPPGRRPAVQPDAGDPAPQSSWPA